MKTLLPLRPTLLTCRILPHADCAILLGVGADPARHTSLGFVTCDQDDSLYAALDHATKFAPVDVVYAKSFYAGSGHASGPLSGECMGVLAGADPDEVAEGLSALRAALETDICFYAQASEDGRTPRGPGWTAPRTFLPGSWRAGERRVNRVRGLRRKEEHRPRSWPGRGLRG